MLFTESKSLCSTSPWTFLHSLTISDELNIISTQMMIDSTQRKMNSHEESANHLHKVQTWSSYALYTPDWSHLHCRIKAVLARVIQVSACVLYESSKNRGEVQIKKVSTLRPCRGIKTNQINQRTWSPKSQTCNLNLSSHVLHLQKTVLPRLNNSFHSLLSLPTISASFLRKMRKFGVFLSAGNWKPH